MVSRGAATQTYSESVAKIGNRDVVGYGWNGEPIYFDRVDYPMPAIRFKENTPDVLVRGIRFGNFQCFNLLISINHCRLWERRRRVTGRNCQCKRKRHSTVLHSVRHSPRWNIQRASSRCTSVSLWLPLQLPSTSHWSWLLSVSFTLSQISEIQTNSPPSPTVYDKDPITFDEAHQKAQLKRMLDLNVGPVMGISSKWDFENNRWK